MSDCYRLDPEQRQDAATMTCAMIEVMRGADPYVALSSLTSLTAWWLAEMLRAVKPAEPRAAIDIYLRAFERNTRIILPHWQKERERREKGQRHG